MAEGGSKYLPISDGMAKDIDSGKAATRDLADFLPDAVAQELYDSSNPGPVHAENLIPISPQQGAAMRAIDPESGSLPKFPSTRRVLPAPFKRDVVTGGSHGKAWTLVTAERVRPGDIVTDMGLISAVEEQIVYENLDLFVHGESGPEHLGTWKPDDKVATGKQYLITGGSGKQVTWPAGREVKVFRSRTS